MVVLDQLARAADRVAIGSPCPGSASRGASSIVRSSDVEVVPERIGRLAGQSPTVGEIRSSRWSAAISTPSCSRHELAVGVTRRGDELPAVEAVARLDELGSRWKRMNGR